MGTNKRSAPLKILILKPSSLGDVVQALPVLRLIKRHLPDSQIYWWIDSRLAPLLEGDPDLTGTILFDRRHWVRPQNWSTLWHSIRWIREQAFDWVIDLQCLFRSGSFAWLANGALTVGLDEPREGARAFYDIAVRRPSYHTHAIDWYLGVLPVLGVPVSWAFDWLPIRSDAAETVRQRAASANGRWFIIQPGARWANKCWPTEHFAELVRRLATTYPDLRFAILGGEQDVPRGEAIARVAPQRCLDLTGRTSLAEMVEWIRLSQLMVTNDTGPMHVAAALGKPVIAVFGPTEPRRTGPYGQLEHTLQLTLPCVPCMKSYCTYFKPFECLRGLAPVTVFDAVQRRLAMLQK